MIAADAESLSMGQRPGFIRFCDEMNPRYDIPSRTYLTNNALPSLDNAAKSTVAETFAGVSFWATSDIWSDKGKKHQHISLTCQYIDNEFVLRNFLIGCPEFKGSHTNPNIFKKWVQMLLSWNIPRVRDGVEIDEEADINCDDYTGWEHLLGIATDNGAIFGCS